MMTQPKISLIWGMDKHRLIGRDNALPWSLPADMQWFRKQTMGKPILMGRKTYASIGRPLPGRLNLVLSRQDEPAIEGCTRVTSLDAARDAAGDAQELMVMGGAEVYQQLIPKATRLYITHIDASFEGDAWFPELNMSAWTRVFHEPHAADERNPYPYTFEIWEK